MSYVDGFIAAVPKGNKQKYIVHAEIAAQMFKEYGALQVVEAWEDDVPEGEVTSFPMAVYRKSDEVVVFSWVIWPSRSRRDEAWEKITKDPRMSPEHNPMPFDGKRIIYGGFTIIVES